MFHHGDGDGNCGGDGCGAGNGCGHGGGNCWASSDITRVRRAASTGVAAGSTCGLLGHWRCSLPVAAGYACTGTQPSGQAVAQPSAQSCAGRPAATSKRDTRTWAIKQTRLAGRTVRAGGSGLCGDPGCGDGHGHGHGQGTGCGFCGGKGCSHCLAGLGSHLHGKLASLTAGVPQAEDELVPRGRRAGSLDARVCTLHRHDPFAPRFLRLCAHESQRLMSEGRASSRGRLTGRSSVAKPWSVDRVVPRRPLWFDQARARPECRALSELMCHSGYVERELRRRAHGTPIPDGCHVVGNEAARPPAAARRRWPASASRGSGLYSRALRPGPSLRSRSSPTSPSAAGC